MTQKNSKQSKVLKTTGLSLYSLESEFNECGYRIVWDNHARMTSTERWLFSEYLSSRSMCLLRFGAANVSLRGTSPSIRALHEIAATLLHICQKFNTTEAINTALIDNNNILEPIMAYGLSHETAHTLLALVLEALNKVAVNSPLSKALDSLYTELALSRSLSFSLDENSLEAQSPMVLSVSCRNKAHDIELSKALKLFADNKKAQDNIIETLRLVAKHSELCAKLYNDGNIIDSIPMTPQNVYAFLTEVDMYERYGIVCKIPQRWRKHKGTLGIGVSLGNHESVLDADSLISFDVNLSLDGETLTPREIEALMSSADGDLFLFRGRWVELTRNDVAKVLAAYTNVKNAHDKGIALSDAIRSFLLPQELLDEDDIKIDVSSGEWLRAISENLISPHGISDVDLGDKFLATLRPYQSDGVKWLLLMQKFGLGACLCDDMGLGKTVQAIAVLEQLRMLGKTPSLIIIPASLLLNWQQEISRFAPGIRYKVLHNSVSDLKLESSGNVDVYITTYSMVSRVKELNNVIWNCIIIDEAQSIKNPQTIQSRAVKRLKAQFKIAMTGTPVENSAMDLWSIFDFLNTGLLGTSTQFLTMVNNSSFDNARLKQLVRPFILRRVKTDKSIMSELPDKIEMKCYCSLTKAQAILYKQITDSLTSQLYSLNGMERRGMVLSCILRLKQICNHPDQFEGHGAYLPQESGKFERVIELCEAIRDANERVLVFTQFKEMCQPLSHILSDVFGKHGFVLHGSTSVSERGRIVEEFNNPNSVIPYMVLSLRAGGLGLNLTAANHVIHFDRWWNPAVENQATDRAFRIGQTRNVLVHKLICSGTLEEKIDSMIESKKNLADNIVGFDTKLTELSDSELLSMLSMEIVDEG